jgi:hypothetical protein
VGWGRVVVHCLIDEGVDTHCVGGGFSSNALWGIQNTRRCTSSYVLFRIPDSTTRSTPGVAALLVRVDGVASNFSNARCFVSQSETVEELQIHGISGSRHQNQKADSTRSEAPKLRSSEAPTSHAPSTCWHEVVPPGTCWWSHGHTSSPHPCLTY